MTKDARSLHRFAVTTALATLGLIFVGGLVTSTGSGLSVPDWPLSYGRVWPPMIGGVFFEHGHRMVAATVGFLTVLQAFFFAWKEERKWVKAAAWSGVGLVVLQGVLGGLTVLFRLPKPISIAHACTAQTFFCLMAAIAVWTSPRWRNARSEAPSDGAQRTHQLAVALFAVTYLQLVLGAILRHTGWVFPLHVAGAVMVTVLTAALARRLWRSGDAGERRLCRFLVGALLLQVSLGGGTYWALVHRFDVVPKPFWAILLITAHVAVGALVLGTTLVLALLTYADRFPYSREALKTRVTDYFELTKPGISFMAGVTALAGFVLGERGNIDLWRLVHTTLGTFLVAGGAGTLNMLIEKESDGKMRRTQRRPLPSGRMKPAEALLLGTFLAGTGIAYLASAVNVLTAVIAALTLAIYLYMYTPLKKISAVCVSVGAVAGALPPVMGWTAATGKLSIEAWVLFGIQFFWQFPHFLSLAWLYKEDYEAGGYHMLPMREPDGTAAARSMVMNSFALWSVSCLPTYFGLTGRVYLATAFVLGAAMTIYSFRFFLDRSRSHARRLFFASLIYMPLLVLMMVISRASVLF